MNDTRSSMQRASRARVVALAVCAGACGSGTVGEPKTASAPALVPATVTMGLGTTRRLAVRNFASDSLVWASSDSNHARVDQTGLIRAVRLGTTVISASEHGDPARTAAAALTVVPDGLICCGRIASISIPTLNDARSGAPVPADAAHDSVSIVATATEWRLYSRLQLIISGVRDTILTSPVPADFFEGLLRIGWNTDARAGGARVFPNGTYHLELRLVNGPDTARSPNTLPVTLANP
jgi:hypothetical protein